MNDFKRTLKNEVLVDEATENISWYFRLQNWLDQWKVYLNTSLALF